MKEKILLFLLTFFIFGAIAAGKLQADNNSIPKGFFYVYQDNYIIVNMNDSAQKEKYKYLYSDGASSCIIIILVGKNKNGEDIVSLAHISRINGFEEYFKDVVFKQFSGAVEIYAQGANPPYEKSSQDTKKCLMKIIAENDCVVKEKLYFSGIELSLSQGSPIENNRDGFGIDLQTMEVSNKHFALKMSDRDPTGGTMTLYAAFGRKLTPPIWLKNAKDVLSFEEINSMLKLASKDNRLKELDGKSDEEITRMFSTTPSVEVDWFPATIKMKVEYMNKHKDLKRN